MRRELRTFTSLDRVRHCGRTPTDAGLVVLRKDATSCGWSGLQHCGSTWACPVCSAKIAEHRRTDLHGLMLAHRARRGGFGMLTLTMRHRKCRTARCTARGRCSCRQSLAALWDDLSLAWRKVQQHRTWREELRPHLTGYVRVVEVTHGRNGWHVHLHAFLFTRRRHSEQWFTVMEQLVIERWSAALVKVGRSADPGAQQLRRLEGDPTQALADYFAKSTFELMRSDLKGGRHGNRTPFGILRDLVGVTGAGGDADDFDLWHEWEQASRGRRQFGYSRGLRDELAPDVPDLTDEQVVEEDQAGDAVVSVDLDTWKVLEAHGWDLRLVEIADACTTVAMARQHVRSALTGWSLVPAD